VQIRMKNFTPSWQSREESAISVIERVRQALNRLAGAGWAELFRLHGLDILATNLAAELARPLPQIDRHLPGFEDFALEGCRGVEPGKPAHSLLFHGFASPQVTNFRTSCKDQPLTAFPTPLEIEAVENLVYGTDPPSVDDLRVRAGGAHLAIVVFASEYRPAIATVHQKHADMCYSRTGVSRVGTHPAEYIPAARGYLPFVDGDEYGIRVLPCRYTAYVAGLAPGDKGGHGPLRFIEAEPRPSAAVPPPRNSDAGLAQAPPALRRRVSDRARNFWVPLHKLFEGTECIRGRNITLRLACSHVNEKIRRTHLRFLSAGHNGGWLEPDISQPPFIFHDGIAEFSSAYDDGSWLLAPVTHCGLVEPAMYRGRPLTYLVPKAPDEGGMWGVYQSSLNLIELSSGARSAPEYVHARHVLENGRERDLNKEPDVKSKVAQGGYHAKHYVDFTGDGWIDVECSELALEIPRRLPAYSIVASTDFFPNVSQTDLMNWTDQSVAPSVLKVLWTAPGAGSPESLADERYAANLQLTGAGFDPGDDTMTAIVGAFGSGGGKVTQIDRQKNNRESMLPDGAAGVFAPGWDVSYDRTSEVDPDDTGASLTPGVTFLTNYGLGSPFVEDSKLCAALSSFWPAVAPDVTREFAPGKNYATATPLSDEVIGLGAEIAWDGTVGPLVDYEQKVVEYTALAYGDYVRTALERRFNIRTIGQTSADEYLARTLTMALVYLALDVAEQKDKLQWSVLSFCSVAEEDADMEDALKETGRQIDRSRAYRYEMVQHDPGLTRPSSDPAKFDKALVDIKKVVLLFADPSIVMKREDDGRWSIHELRR